MSDGRASTAPARWRAVSWLLAALTAAALSYSVLRFPIQVTDSLIPILDAREMGSVSAAFVAALDFDAYLRPLRMAQIQALYELAGGSAYSAAYRGFHVALVIALLALFTAAVPVRTAVDTLVFAFALTVLTGSHTFLGLIWEAYPVNHFLDIAVFCLLAVVLCRSRGGWWVDGLAALTFVAAALTLESGLLVYVVIVAAWATGMRGVSRRGVLALTVLLIGYFGLRAYLGTGSPELMERSSGFGLRKLEPDELIARFGDRPYPFYAYNVVTSMVSLLFSEPREGVWTVPVEWMRGRVAPGTILNIVSSTITTAVIGWFAVTRVRVWRRGEQDDLDRLLVVALAVCGANAAISYGYTKDVILSAAGVFYALAAYVAMRHVVLRARADGRWLAVLVLAGTVGIASTGWAIRAVGLQFRTHMMTMDVRNEWVRVDEWLAEQRESPTDDGGRQLVEQLRNEAIQRDVVNHYLIRSWAGELFR